MDSGASREGSAGVEKAPQAVALQAWEARIFHLIADVLRELERRPPKSSQTGSSAGDGTPGEILRDPTLRKGYGAFYTREPIAYFLAFLAILSPNEDWDLHAENRENLGGEFRVCDFACGAGVLLSASYAAIQALRRLAISPRGGGPSTSRGDRGSTLRVRLWGFDAVEDAIRAAGELLTPSDPRFSPLEVRLIHIPVDESGSLGSLDLWWGGELGGREGGPEIHVPAFDLVIMNPPFSRATAPGRSESRPRIFDFAPSPEGFQRLWSRYSRLIRDVEAAAVSDEGVRRTLEVLVGRGRPFTRRSADPIRAGAALPFFFLADRYLRPGGRVALVLPRAALEGSAYLLMRAALASRYHLEYVVVGSSSGGSFSHSTQLSEVLLVARKLRGGDGAWRDTRVVILRRQPETPLEGALLAAGIVGRLAGRGSGIVRAGRSEAEVRAIRAGAVERFAWNLAPLLGLPPQVGRLTGEMTEGRLLGVQVRLVRLMDLPGLRATNPRKFRGREFTSRFSPSPSGPLRILDRAGRAVFNRLELDPSKARPIEPKTEEAASFYRERAGRLLVPEAVRFNSTPLIATWSPEVLASSRAHMLRADPRLERALCAWMNSTFALAWLRALFTTVEGGFGHVYGWHLRALMVPDLSDDETLRALESTFLRHSGELWPPLPDQYREDLNGAGGQRLSYDLEILSILTESSGSSVDPAKAEAGLRSLYLGLLELLELPDRPPRRPRSAPPLGGQRGRDQDRG